MRTKFINSTNVNKTLQYCNDDLQNVNNYSDFTGL